MAPKQDPTPAPITPTIGRVLHFFENDEAKEQLAMVADVHSDNCVNVAIWDHRGRPVVDPPLSVTLVQPGEENPEEGCFCTWLPHQV